MKNTFAVYYYTITPTIKYNKTNRNTNIESLKKLNEYPNLLL